MRSLTGFTTSATRNPNRFSISSPSLNARSAVTAKKELLPMQPGDVAESFADIETARRDLGFDPKTSIEEGIARFVAWYKHYHKIN